MNRMRLRRFVPKTPVRMLRRLVHREVAIALARIPEEPNSLGSDVFPPPSEEPVQVAADESSRAPGSLGRASDLASPRLDLAHWTSTDLASELLARMHASGPPDRMLLQPLGLLSAGGLRVDLASEAFPAPKVAGWLALELAHSSARAFDNRFAPLQPEVAFSLFPAGDVTGKVILELGCGSQNPLGNLALYYLLGARRVIGVDLEVPADPRLVAWGVAQVVARMATDPQRLVGGWPLSRQDLMGRVDQLDMSRLWEGDPNGLDQACMQSVAAAADDLPFGAGEIDCIYSNSFLEHVEDADAVIAEMARVVRPGGWTWHNIDGTDHASHTEPGPDDLGPIRPETPPLGFLREPSGPALVNGSNRLRPLEFISKFEEAGFEPVAMYPSIRQPISEAERQKFAEPWRSMPEEILSTSIAALSFRRR